MKIWSPPVSASAVFGIPRVPETNGSSPISSRIWPLQHERAPEPSPRASPPLDHEVGHDTMEDPAVVGAGADQLAGPELLQLERLVAPGRMRRSAGGEPAER